MPQISKILKDSDVITTILLLGISFIFYSGSGVNAKDWVFPLMATFSLFAVHCCELGRFYQMIIG